MKTGIELIAEERQRQIEKEGYTSDHDDEHEYFELSAAAICYVEQSRCLGQCIWQDRVPARWPFSRDTWNPLPNRTNNACPQIEKVDSMKMLTRAGALIAAEIDRLQRLKYDDKD